MAFVNISTFLEAFLVSIQIIPFISSAVCSQKSCCNVHKLMIFENVILLIQATFKWFSGLLVAGLRIFLEDPMPEEDKIVGLRQRIVVSIQASS